MVIAQSETFSDWGLQYSDAIDQFNFLRAGTNKFAIYLSNGNIGINNASPAYKLDVVGDEMINGTLRFKES
ncbi:MAG: hypothetical protein JST21_02395 [Bacteroidetes bacterium]|nr:hypothetical protein [Bacteroidota bacterium]